MTDETLRLRAEFKNNASAGIKTLSKDLAAVKPHGGMLAAQRWMSDFRAAGQKAAEATRPLSGALNSLGVGGIAASLSLGEMVKQFRDLAAEIPRLRELSRESGISETQIKRMAYAARMLGADGDKVGGAISVWAGKMAEFRKHGGAFYQELLHGNQDLAKKMAAEGPNEMLEDTLGFLARFPEGAKAYARSMGQIMSDADAVQGQKKLTEELFGGDDILPLVANLQKMQQAFASADKDVTPITPQLIQQAEALNQSLARFDQTWSNFKSEVGPTVLNGLSETVDKLDRVFKLVQAHPVETGIAAGGAAALYARNRIMRGSQTFGLRDAATKHLEAAAALKGAAASLSGRGDPGAPSGSGPGGGMSSLAGRWATFALGLPGIVANAPGMDASGDEDRQANYDAIEGLGKTIENALHLPQLRERIFGSAGLPGSDAKKDTADAIKAGTLAAWREIAQQQDGGGGSFGGGAGHGGSAGMPNMRYGRGASGAFRHGPGDPNGAFNPRAPTTPGTFRPQYKLGDADLDDRVVNTIAGEAVTSNPESIDAVVNNMMNRVGSKGWGPSGNLLDVARAPGQYAGYRGASAKEAERIRDRIRAITSGGVPDNTNGANSYRAASYRGPWAQKHAADGRVVGGNRFAFDPAVKNGPFAPYPSSKTAADAFAAHLREINGGAPQAHASGGPIRGPGGPRSDSIFARLSNGEFVVNAKAAGQWAPFLDAINSGHMPAFADGGRVGSWLSFFHRPDGQGGMGASFKVARAAVAMMQGESGRGLNPSIYRWDVNGPSGGTAQWHDVTTGRNAGKVHRLSDLMRMAMIQHADWSHDVPLQQAWWKHEAKGPLRSAWQAMLHAHSATEALRAGINKFEVPADKQGEFMKRLPNLVRLARQDASPNGPARHEIDPIRLDIHHHQDGRVKSLRAASGQGVKLNIRSGPTMVEASRF